MIIVSSISLSTMLSNNLLIPYGFVGSWKILRKKKNNKRILNSRKIAIFSLIILSYFIYRCFGLFVSFHRSSFICSYCAISTCLFWRFILKEDQKGAVTGIILGFVVCFYTLLPLCLRNHFFFQYIYSRRTLEP
jgi:Na+/proline symporter